MKQHQITFYLKIITAALSLLLTLPSICPAKSNAGDCNALFAAANAAYTKGQYAKAISRYQQILAQGYHSGPLYYNLGNAYFKSGASGQAVLYYEKAKRLIPGDADLQANLSYALNHVNEGALTWQNRLWETAVFSFNLEQIWIYASIALFGLAALLCLVILTPEKLTAWKPWPQVLLALTSICLITLLSLAICTGVDRSRTYAVTVKNGGDVRFEPNPQATVHFNLSEGARVRVLERKAGWSLVGRRDGVRGWVPNRYLETI
jgi:tetratricopeptide (TPR) repeat protein